MQREYIDLINEMKSYITPHIIERGYDYYISDHVSEVHTDQEWITATVMGSYDDYTVRIHREEFYRSECDCPYDDYCKHMAAVVYYVAKNGDKLLSRDQQNPVNHVEMEKKIEGLSEELLVDILQELFIRNPVSKSFFQQILNEKERSLQLKGEEIHNYNWAEAVAYFKRETPKVFAEAEALFEYTEEEYGYDEMDSIDFSEGIKVIDQWQEDLDQLIDSEVWIAGLAGYIVTIENLRIWKDEMITHRYTGYMDDYDFDRFDELIGTWLSKLEKHIDLYRSFMKKSKRNPDPLTEQMKHSILQNCHETEDFIDWFPILRESSSRVMVNCCT